MNDERRPAKSAAAFTIPAPHDTARRGGKPSAEQVLEQPHGVLNRGHLAELGHGRRQVDAIFRELPVVVIPGTRRPMIRAADYLELIEASTYNGTRVR